MITIMIMIILLPKCRKKYKIEKLENKFFLQSGKNGVFFLFLYIFDFIKWKIFHHSHLFPRSAKKLSNFLHFFIYSGMHFTNAICLHEVEKL